MRKRRAILYNDSGRISSTLKLLFDTRGYEVIVISRPSLCPLYTGEGEGICPQSHACGDLVIVEDGPRMKGIELLSIQSYNGCKLTPRNKAVIVTQLSSDQKEAVKDLGIAVFSKPVDAKKLEAWVVECEKRRESAETLAGRRSRARETCAMDVWYRVPNDNADRSGKALNVSDCGICIRTAKPLQRKQVISLWAEDHSLSEVAEVRWQETSGDGTCLAGLTFCVA